MNAYRYAIAEKYDENKTGKDVSFAVVGATYNASLNRKNSKTQFLKKENFCCTLQVLPSLFVEGEILEKPWGGKKMKSNKIIISVIAVILLIAAGGIYLKFSLSENLRSPGFPSLSTVPAGFSFVNEKAIDTGNWCEVSYENDGGNFFSLDCYELGTFDTAFLQNYAESSTKISIGDKDAMVYQNLAGNDDKIQILAWEDDENNALCLLGGNVSIDEMVQAAGSIKYDMKKSVTKSKNNEITSSTQEIGMIEAAALKDYSDILKSTTKPLFDKYMENDKAIVEFDLESLYKAFEFHIADDLLVEVFDYDYFMKAKNDVILAGGMQRGDDGNIRGFTGAFGQIAAVSRGGQLIKALPVLGLDVKLEAVCADEEDSQQIKEKVLTNIKSPAYFIRDALYN